MIAAASPARRRTSPPRATHRRIQPDAGNARRDALVTQHIGLVHHVARQMANRLSTAAELDELVSAGTMGLLQAAEAFDTARGLSFSTFAVPRIRGAILDELRKVDHVPRNVRRRNRDMGRARDVLTASLRRVPTHDELSHVMQVPVEQIRRWESDAESASVSSLDQPVRADVAGATLADTVTDERAGSMEDLLTHEAEVEQLKRAIAGLKEQERTVLALNYFEELKLQEIADVLGLSVCRISQIRTAALAKLRVVLSDLRAA
ncbi:MAG TPA: FliA/WhiG family RNA polymerase sigma factor [Gemmatimonadaceae bacterium]|nr:FliA/WhiG family RNA polymerase sigma factor [Gemmatimonadaceae bacterium]